MELEHKQKVVEAYKALKRMYISSSIELGDYGKVAIQLAYDLFVGDEPSLALGILHEMPTSYYNEHMSQQCKLDHEFGLMCTWVGYQLKLRGLVPGQVAPEINCWGKVGLA